MLYGLSEEWILSFFAAAEDILKLFCFFRKPKKQRIHRKFQVLSEKVLSTANFERHFKGYFISSHDISPESDIMQCFKGYFISSHDITHESDIVPCIDGLHI